ncbi:NADH-quinone oxidoreductase subunit N [Parapedobacter koreensis]|uniref:NADH-quinone oxidoreductase subunit N n=1 Tax=Parapedobacter koreensis TaxID=332977 RepID=A0A1H7J3X3_9SPHI|nr:NADH-quinone oxidoreductase subunit N [Parapedobacter koreensis]SEK69094.1 NADH dehydrogenase subunit N [Parapedobacter koreensis]
MTELLPHITDKLDHILAGLPMLLPELVLAVAFLATIASGLFVDHHWRNGSYVVTTAGIVLTGIYGALQLALPTVDDLLFGMATMDALGQYVRILTSAVCLLFVLFVKANPGFNAHRKKTSDLYSILLAVHIGLNLMGMATNWLMVFVAIEMVSIGSYLMVGYLSNEARQTEAAMKYVLFGSVCSAVMLYGLSFLYGFTGDLDFTSAAHIRGLAGTAPLLTATALLFVFTGIGFKLSFVPFHFWTPDVYQGAPTPVTAFLSTAPKIAGIALLSRIMYAWPADSAAFQYVQTLVLVSAIATMLLGNLAALRQTNVKRMMAYSSIGHTGFLMMAVLAYSSGEYAILLFYLAVYALMNMGVFILADYIEARTGATNVSEYRGLGKTLPTAFVSFVILLISLTGLPPTAGFIAKLFVFSAVFSNWQLTGNTGMVLLLIVGALTTVLSLFYYFKVPLNAFLRTSEDAREIRPARTYVVVLATLITAAVLLLGIFPGWLVDLF